MINPANPVGAFLQGRGMAQQQQAQQQQMDLRNREFGMRETEYNQGQQDREREQQLELLGEIRAAGSWVLSDPAQAPQRLVEVQNTFRPIFGDMVDSVTLEALPGLVAQAQQEFANNLPSNVREWEYFNGLPEDEQQAYLNLRRGGTVRDVGGVPTYIGGGGGVQNPLSTLDQETQAEYALAEAKSEGAVQTGTERGEDGVVRPQRGARLSDTAETRIMEVTARAETSRQAAASYSDLADQMEQTMPPGGAAAAWADRFRTLTGQENAETLLRRRWNELRVSNAIQNLPPGVASDKDIELVMSAFLPEFANADTVARFLRGLANAEQIQAEYNEFVADWLSNNGTVRGMDQAWREQVGRSNQRGGQGGQQGGLEIGTEQDGYRYRGGDPADPNSWERI